MDGNAVIKPIRDDLGLRESIRIIRDSFITVANDLGLSVENAPTNPAFLTLEKLTEAAEKGIEMFGLFYEGRQVGFVALEKANETLYYMERLAVLPEFRHHGFGVQLMDFVFDYVKSLGGEKVSIAIIDENQVLKRWYLNYGFVVTGNKHFPHLSFTVCFMERRTKSRRDE